VSLLTAFALTAKLSCFNSCLISSKHSAMYFDYKIETEAYQQYFYILNITSVMMIAIFGFAVWSRLFQFFNR